MSTPAHAPYTDVEVGEEIEVRVFTDDAALVTCECTYREDTFGGQADLNGLTRLERMTEIDRLIEGVCSIVWNELLGTPVFREEDDGWVERVDAIKPWEGTRRVPTQGWVDVDAVADALADASDEEARALRAGEPPADDLPDERDHVAATLGDADVADLKLKQEEMAALMRGEIPEALVERLLKARSTENLLDSVYDAITEAAQGSHDLPDLVRARREIEEVRSRFSG